MKFLLFLITFFVSVIVFISVECLASFIVQGNFSSHLYLNYILSDMAIILIISYIYTNLRIKSNQREKELRDKINQLDAILYTSDQAYWHWDFINDKMIMSNNAYEMLGYETEVWQQNLEGFYSMVHPSDINILKKRVITTLNRIKNGKDPQYEAEFRMKCSNNSWRWILSSGTLVKPGHDGKSKHLFGTLTDISSFKRIEQSLLQKNKELEHFVYSVSHDLKSPLVTIEGFASIIIKELEKCIFECDHSEFIKDSASEINKASKELAVAIDAILELSRIGKLHTNRSIVNTKDIIDRILNMNKKKINNTNAEIIVINHPNLYVQEEVFVSILQNLIDNALQHACSSKKQLKIEIQFNKSFRGIILKVKDNGPGIPLNQLEIIFDAYRRFTNEGKGLGLSIVKRGAEFHGGRAWATNNEDDGSTFYVELKGTKL